MSRRVRALLARSALALAGVGFVLGAAECGMRIAGVGEVMTFGRDSRFGYLMRPSQRVSTYGDPIEINRLGLRGPEVRVPKPDGVLRVLFLGDSITYGGGRVPERELFCRRLEQLAAEDGLRVESVNVSAPGWSPQNWSAWLAANGALDADVVVAVIPAIDRARPFASLDQHGMPEAPPLLRLAVLWLKLEAIRLPGVPLSDEALEANARSLQAAIAGLGATPIYGVLVGSRGGGDEHPGWWTPYQTLFPDALDLRSGFAAADFLDDVHFASSGHARIAERIYARLRSRLQDLAAGRVPRALELQALPPPDE